MSIRLGIYDFFAYTIPGGLYVFIVGYVSVSWGLIVIDAQAVNAYADSLKDIGLYVVLVIGIAAYLLGILLDSISKPWHRLFTVRRTEAVILEKFKADHPTLDIAIELKSWGILMAYLRRESIDLASDIERHNAARLMLRNVSFALLVFSVVQLIEFIQHQWYVGNFLLCVGCLLASLSAAREGAKFDQWFYGALYEAVAARSLDFSTLVRRKPAPVAAPEAPAPEQPAADRRPT